MREKITANDVFGIVKSECLSIMHSSRFDPRCGAIKEKKDSFPNYSSMKGQ